MKEELREIVVGFGADVCGFAGVERFTEAPEGFHPCDIWNACKSVISIGIALPKGLFQVKPDLIYGHFNSKICETVDEIALKTAKIIETRFGGNALPLPCNGPYEYWDADKMEGRGLISMKHAAVCAGNGSMGKSTLLLNERFGSRLVLGAVLTDIEIPSDMLAHTLCTEDCRLCLDNCPVHALDGTTAVQKPCRMNTYSKNKRGHETVVCNRCRSICPMSLGK